MTVNTISSVAEFVTNGVTTNFPFYFKFLANEDLVVTYVNPAGISSPLTLGTHYTVNGAGNDAGGSVVTTTALAGPGQLVVAREMDAYQQTSLRNQGKFLAETHEDVFDRLTMLIQQGLSTFTRALVRPFGRNYYDAENRRIANLADPVEPQDAVNSRSMQSMIEQALAGVIGGAGWFLQFGLGAIARTFQDKMRDQYSVKDFGAKLDGVTDDTAAVQAAVTAAIAAVKRLYWPDGQAVLSGNIAGFHQIKHVGPGSISRDGIVFYISPLASQTNNLYLAVTGNDSNDGLSPSYPRLTLAGSGTALSGFGPFLEGTWVVNLTAGQYNESNFTVPPGLRGRNPIYFKGPVSVHPVSPTAIIDGLTAGAFGIQLNRESTVYLQDIWLRNYQSYGIVGQDNSMLYAARVHVTGVPGGPAVKMQQGRVVWTDGLASTSQMGFSFISGCTFTITGSSALLGAGTRILNNTQCGVQAQEQSSGHVDYAYLDTNPVGYNLVARSRVHSLQSTITNSVTAAVRAYGASDWYNNGSSLIGNSTGELLYTGSIEVVHYQNNVAPTRRPIDSVFVTHTGTTAVTTLKTYADAFSANNFWNSTKSMRFVVTGELSGTAGTKNLTINIDGAPVLGFTIPAAAAGSYVIDGTLTALGSTQQTYSATCTVNGQTSQAASGARGIAMSSGSAPVATIAATLVSAADSLTIRTVSMFET